MVVCMIEALLHLIASISTIGLSMEEAALYKQKRELEARIAELEELIAQEEEEAAREEFYARQSYRFQNGAGYSGARR